MSNKLVIMVKKIMLVVGSVITVLLAVVATLLHFSVDWMFATWNHLTMDELVYHLTAPMDGTNEGMIEEYLNLCAAPAILVLLLMIIVIATLRKGKRRCISFAIVSLISIILISVDVKEVWDTLEIGDYAALQSEESDFIKDYYVNPGEVAISFPEQKRNLIYIFLESMETTYADIENGGAFEENVIPELTQLALENEDFSGESSKINGAYSLTGATWTMGAMFAHTSGLPLEISIDGNAMNTQESFFAGAITLGDILDEAGYSQTLLIGSDAAFGGRELYFTEHGNYEMMDYNYAVENGLIPADYRVFWGYEDQRLIEFAKEKLTELSESEQPFNLTMLTVDTHFEDGYVCERCSNSFGDDQYANVMKCSSEQIYELVQWIQEQPFYENTTIVIAGDHPTMDKNFCENISDDYKQRVFTAYLNTPVSVEQNVERQYSTMDFYPTTLAALGVEIEGNRLGLGVNLFSQIPTLIERFGIDKVETELSKKSTFMETLANIETDENE